MVFSPRQIDVIRCSLSEYRLRLGATDKGLSWANIAKEMEADHLEFGDLYKGQPPFDIKGEALRRFVAGGTLLSHRTAWVADFLKRAEFLVDEQLDFDNRDQAERSAIVGFLAHTSPGAKRLLAGYVGTLYASCGRAPTCERIELRFELDQSELFLHAEERRSSSEFAEDLDKPDGAAIETSRFGYGFLSTPQNTLHVFVRGASVRDRVHYLRLVVRGDGAVFARAGASPYFMIGNDESAEQRALMELGHLLFTDSPPHADKDVPLQE